MDLVARKSRNSVAEFGHSLIRFSDVYRFRSTCDIHQQVALGTYIEIETCWAPLLLSDSRASAKDVSEASEGVTCALTHQLPR